MKMEKGFSIVDALIMMTVISMITVILVPIL